ncbi:MAG: response regulator transcription factor [Eubacteriales bacterium]|nr:response regulator transcription factor [Eubacteriales bacterium]
MQSKPCILIVEDEASISNFISTALSANGYAPLIACNGQEALAMVTSHCPDAILLDLGLPDVDGQKILRMVREWSPVPIIVVSARGHERDKVEALDLGADDYITKPFGISELLARVRTALRHSRSKDEPVQDDVFCVGGLTIDFDRRYIKVDGKAVHLTQIEYKIVALLARYAGRVLTHDYILKSVWGPLANCDNQILRVNMANIRRKLEQNPAEPRYIHTEVGVGYRMIEE